MAKAGHLRSRHPKAEALGYDGFGFRFQELPQSDWLELVEAASWWLKPWVMMDSVFEFRFQELPQSDSLKPGTRSLFSQGWGMLKAQTMLRMNFRMKQPDRDFLRRLY